MGLMKSIKKTVASDKLAFSCKRTFDCILLNQHSLTISLERSNGTSNGLIRKDA